MALWRLWLMEGHPAWRCPGGAIGGEPATGLQFSRGMKKADQVSASPSSVAPRITNFTPKRATGVNPLRQGPPHQTATLDSDAAPQKSDSGEKEDHTKDSKLQSWEEFGHKFEAGELEALKRSITEMALSRIDGQDNLYLGGIWALRRSDSLTERRISHVLSLVGFNPSNLKNFKDEPWSHYGKGFDHLLIDIDDVDDSDLLIELPRAVRFIDGGLRAGKANDKPVLEDGLENLSLGSGEKNEETKDKSKQRGGVFVHCAAGKSRSAAVVIAYLLWRYPNRFDPNITPTSISDPSAAAAGSPPPANRSRRETAIEAVHAALTFIRRTRPMAEPNDGFMEQLALWWEMGCPIKGDIETQPIYQRWAYRREVQENLAVGQAPSRLRFEDEESGGDKTGDGSGLNLRCKKCRRTLATAPFIIEHQPSGDVPGQCQHFFIEPLSWMRSELEKGSLNGRLLCPNSRCGAGVGRYDWKGFKCTCGGWVTPAFSLQRARVDDMVVRNPGAAAGEGGDAAAARRQQSLGIRMPPGSRSGNL